MDSLLTSAGADSVLDSVLITGGTGTFGKAMVRALLDGNLTRRIVVYSRDELKQSEMRRVFDDPRVRFFIGDVRDKDRLKRALDGVDVVIHAAALKQVPACEYNPAEAIKTNIGGAQNVIDAAIDCGVKEVVALSTDKAVNPINLYGATKLASDKLFVAANAYSGTYGPRFSVVRYGNVACSRGSVIPFFLSCTKEIPITDSQMTRFWITIDEAVELVFTALDEAIGGEVFVSKLPSFRVVDLAEAVAPEIPHINIGIRPGEKVHEVMITETDKVIEYPGHYVILPQFDWWESSRVMRMGKELTGFRYTSDSNDWWLTVEDIRERIDASI